jgi:hypothetical protein
MAFGLNIFRTVTADLTTAGADIYTAPFGYSAIVLMAQITNITSGVNTASMSVIAPDTSATSLLENFGITGYDSVGALTGKLVLETGWKLNASANNDNTLKLVLSILESKN